MRFSVDREGGEGRGGEWVAGRGEDNKTRERKEAWQRKIVVKEGRGEGERDGRRRGDRGSLGLKYT